MGGLLWALFIGLGGLPYSQLIQILGSGTRTALWLAFAQAASFVWKTVTGNAPLSLANAVSHAIKSLTQTGLCTQSTTPTPSAPVDIVCNNGALRFGALGRNLLNPVGVVIGQNYTPEGDQNPSQNNWRTGLIPIKGGETYAFWGRKKSDNTMSAFNRINWFDADGNNISPRPSYNVYTVTVGTAPSNAAFVGLSCSCYNSSAAITQATFDEFNWMFVQADAEIPYEPFVGGIVADGTPEVLTVSGKNEANVADYSQSFTNRYYVDKAIGVTLEVGVTYTFSCDVECSVTPFGISVGVGNDVVYLVDIVTKPNQTNGRIFVTFTPSATALSNYSKMYVRIPRFTESKTGTVSVSKIQLERSSSATDYEPHVQPQTVTDIPMLLSVNDYKDESKIISGAVTRKVGLWVLNGQESWELNSVYGQTDNAFLSRNIVPFKTNSKTLLCTHFVNKTSVETAGNVSVGVFAGSQISFFCGKDSSINSVDGWKAFIAAQYAAGTPVIVLYPLATETTEQGTPHALHTSEGTNTVSVTSNVSPTQLSVEYAASE